MTTLQFDKDDWDYIEAVFPGGYQSSVEQLLVAADEHFNRYITEITVLRGIAAISGAMRWKESQEYPLYVGQIVTDTPRK